MRVHSYYTRSVADLPWHGVAVRLHLLIEALRSEVAEFMTCANGVTDDLQAVKAALECEWNQGQVEGQVHRLKLVKRQMYGRGQLALLRARVLYAA